MKLLVLADIHSNRAALEAILEKEEYDAVLCLGDLVDYGPEPRSVIKIIRQISSFTIMGNHDLSLAYNKGCVGCTEFFEKITLASRNNIYYRFTEEELNYLKKLPDKILVELDGINILMVHGTVKKPYEGYITPSTPPHIIEEEMHYEGNKKIDLILFGHSHIPMDYQLHDYRIINPGSVGFPRGGDPRASYVVIEDGEIHFRKAKYNVEETINGLKNMNLPEDIFDYLSKLLKRGE